MSAHRRNPLTHHSRFSYYLRTGRRLEEPEMKAASADPLVETKFNPYHDPRNGRFTFGHLDLPGSRVVFNVWDGQQADLRPCVHRAPAAGGENHVFRPEQRLITSWPFGFPSRGNV